MQHRARRSPSTEQTTGSDYTASLPTFHQCQVVSAPPPSPSRHRHRPDRTECPAPAEETLTVQGQFDRRGGAGSDLGRSPASSASGQRRVTTGDGRHRQKLHRAGILARQEVPSLAGRQQRRAADKPQLNAAPPPRRLPGDVGTRQRRH